MTQEPGEEWKGLDYSQPIEALRPLIAKLPEDQKQDALRAWASKEIAKERSSGFSPLPAGQEGIPIIGGLLDEASAGINAGLAALTDNRIGQPYDEGLALTRERSRQADEANPALAFGSKAVAGLATGGAILRVAASAPTVLGRMWQGLKAGTPIGAVEGFTRGEGGIAERVDSAKTGAAVGGVAGFALPGLAAAASRGYGAAADLVSPAITRMRHGPEAAADEILARRIAREGSTPAAKRLDLQKGQAAATFGQNSQAQLPEAIADTSDAMQRLTGSVYRSGAEAGNAVKGALQARQKGPDNQYGQPAADAAPAQRDRILEDVERALRIRSSDTARNTDRKIMAQQAREGARLYQIAREQSEDFDLAPQLEALAERMQMYPGPFADKLKAAGDLFVRQSDEGGTLVNNVTQFDASKKALDDMIEAAQRSGENNMARELTEFKNGLLGAVHGADGSRNTAYRTARQAWGTAAENREAIELGRSALRDGSEISAENFAALNPGQQQLFRLGFLESVRNATARTRPGNDATMLFQEPRVRELLNAIIPQPRRRTAAFANRRERFGEVMRREERMGQTRQAVIGNSATAQRQMDDAEFTGDTIRTMYDRFRHSPGLLNMGLEAIGATMQRVFDYRQDVALALAQRLLTTDRTVQNQILRRLQRRGGPDVFQRFAEQIDQTAAQIASTGSPAVIDVTVDRGD